MPISILEKRNHFAPSPSDQSVQKMLLRTSVRACEQFNNNPEHVAYVVTDAAIGSLLMPSYIKSKKEAATSFSELLLAS